jgi:hypothetical protein
MLSWLRRERGQDLLEYALVLPVLALLLFGIMEFALIFFSYNTINDAAREAARWGVIIDAGAFRDHVDIEDRAREVTDAAGLSGVIPVATVDTDAKTVRVVVTYDMPLVTRIMGSPSVHLQAVSTKRIEVQ